MLISISIKEIALGIGIAIAAGADLKTTRACVNCRELNPIVRPAPVLVVSSTSFLAWYASHKLRQDQRRLWWLPSVATIGIHSAAAIHNAKENQ